MGTIIYFIIFAAIIYGGFFYFLMQKKKKQEEAFKQVDLKKEFLLVDQYQEEFLNNELAFIKKQLANEPIDALNYANLPYTNKDTIKDGLKSLVTLDTVKYQTVQTPKYLVLSNGVLHLLDTDVEGDFSKHLKFNAERLQNSKIKEITLTETAKAYAQQLPIDIKSYKISLDTDDEPIELIIFSKLLFTFATDSNASISDLFSTDSKKSIKEVIMAQVKNLGISSIFDKKSIGHFYLILFITSRLTRSFYDYLL